MTSSQTMIACQKEKSSDAEKLRQGLGKLLHEVGSTYAELENCKDPAAFEDHRQRISEATAKLDNFLQGFPSNESSVPPTSLRVILVTSKRSSLLTEADAKYLASKDEITQEMVHSLLADFEKQQGEAVPEWSDVCLAEDVKELLEFHYKVCRCFSGRKPNLNLCFLRSPSRTCISSMI